MKSIFSNGSGAPSPPETMCSELAWLHLQNEDTLKAQTNFSPASSSSAWMASSSSLGHQQANIRLTNRKSLLDSCLGQVLAQLIVHLGQLRTTTVMEQTMGEERCTPALQSQRPHDVLYNVSIHSLAELVIGAIQSEDNRELKMLSEK